MQSERPSSNINRRVSTLAGAILCLGFAPTLLAAQSAATGAAVKPAEKCLNDLATFDDQMAKEGYWLGGAGYGYGYPMEGYGLFGPGLGPGPGLTGYQSARLGYKLRTLIASANILAHQGKQQPCEDVLAATREIYKFYVADMHKASMPQADVPGWRQLQINAAQPVTSNTSFRSDELLGTGVRTPQNEGLGSVEDIVMSPQRDKIAYLVIARGGIFGFDEKYVPVPWEAFKITPNVKLLVLDTTKSVLDGAPQVNNEQFAAPGQFDRESQKVDAYWKAHLSK